MSKWHYIIRPCRNNASRWIALAKLSPFVTDGDLLKEPGSVKFKFGKTEREAKEKIEAETRSQSNTS